MLFSTHMLHSIVTLTSNLAYSRHSHAKVFSFIKTRIPYGAMILPKHGAMILPKHWSVHKLRGNSLHLTHTILCCTTWEELQGVIDSKFDSHHSLFSSMSLQPMFHLCLGAVSHCPQSISHLAYPHSLCYFLHD